MSAESIKAAKEEADKWEEPEQLGTHELESSVYPVDSLGSILGPAATAIHNATQAPLETCGQSVLAASSMAAQPHYNVRAPHGTVSPLSLYALTGSGSGERKSAADEKAMKPVKKLEEALAEVYAEKLTGWCNDIEAWKVARQKATSKKSDKAEIKTALDGVGAEPLKPLTPYLVAEDPTVEGIFRSFNEGFPSQGCFTDEGGLLIGGHAFNADNMLKTSARLSKLWDGSPFDRTRGGDERKKLYDRRLALHWLIQPDVAVQLFEHQILEAQGFFPRCLLSLPAELAGTREYSLADEVDHPDIVAYWSQLDALLDPGTWPIHKKDCQRLTPKIIRVAEGAFPLIKQWVEHYEAQIGKYGAAVSVKVFISRMLEQALRIAGVLTAVDSGKDATEISIENLKGGMKLAEYSVEQWDRLKREAEISSKDRKAQLLLEWIQDSGKQYVHSMEVSQYGPNKVRKAENRDKAIDVLVESGWLRPVPDGMEIDGKHRKHAWEVYRGEI